MGVRNQKPLVSRDEIEHLRQNRLSRTLLVHMGVMSWTGGSGKGFNATYSHCCVECIKLTKFYFFEVERMKDSGLDVYIDHSIAPPEM